MWLELASTIGTPARRCGRAAAAAKCFLVSYWPLGPSGGGIVCGRVPCPEGRYIATSYALSDGDDDGGGVSRARSAARAFSRREASSSALGASDAAWAAAALSSCRTASSRSRLAASRSRTDSSRARRRDASIKATSSALSASEAARAAASSSRRNDSSRALSAARAFRRDCS